MINFKNLVYELAILQEKVIDLDERIARFETGAAYERAESSHDQMIKKCEQVFCGDEAQDYASFMVNKLIDAGLIEFVKKGDSQ